MYWQYYGTLILYKSLSAPTPPIPPALTIIASSTACKSNPSILFAMHVSVTVCAGSFNASYTMSAISAMNVGSVLGAGHLRQLEIPDSSASSRYSISISSNVSMCSDTKLMGTTTKFFTPLPPSSGRTSSVYCVLFLA